MIFNKILLLLWWKIVQIPIFDHKDQGHNTLQTVILKINIGLSKYSDVVGHIKEHFQDHFNDDWQEFSSETKRNIDRFS